jgi:uncharacterized protein YdaU (DUF1376 family)
MAKDPAFLFYYQDFLVGTEFMSNEEKGIYITALCHMADKGSLSPKHMQSICKGYAFTELLQSKFKTDSNGFYYNERLIEEIEKRRKYSESRRNNAKNVKAYAKHMENENENTNTSFSLNTNSKENDILQYFAAKGYPAEEAKEFFNHYEAQGWVTGNAVPITNWKVKAENWHTTNAKRNLEGKTNGKFSNSNNKGGATDADIIAIVERRANREKIKQPT